MFAIDSKFYRFCEILYKIILVNILFLITSLPIITFGASMSALLRVFHQNDAKIITSYFVYFKENLLRTLPLAGFNLCSFLFYLMIRSSVSMYDSLFLQLIFVVFVAFLLTYNMNVYLLHIHSKEKIGYFELFHITFTFSLVIFYKVIWICLLFGTLYYFLYPVAGGLVNIILVGAPLFFYQKLFFHLVDKVN